MASGNFNESQRKAKASKVVNLRIDDELMTQIDKAREVTREDRSTWLRNAIHARLGQAPPMNLEERVVRLEKEVFKA